MRHAVAAVLVAIAAPAAAETPAEHAAQLFEEGRALAKEGKYTDACDRFEQSFELDAAVGTELNLADCVEHLGHRARAWQLFDHAAQQSAHDGDDARVTFARQRADIILRQLGTVALHVADPDLPQLAITLDGAPLRPERDIHRHVDPGTLEIVATAPGHRQLAQTVRVDAGQNVDVDIPALPERVPPHVRHSWRNTAIVVGALGIASLIEASIAGITANSDFNDAGPQCTQTSDGGVTCTHAGNLALMAATSNSRIATITAITGVTLVAAAVVIYFKAPRDRPPVDVAVSGHGASVVISGRF